MSPDPRRWLLRALLLLPTYWVLRDTIRLHASDYVSLVVIPWAVLVLASWLVVGRLLDPRETRLRLVLLVVALVCGWGVLHVGRMATRAILVPSLVAAAATVVPPLGVAAAGLVAILGAFELALRLQPGLLPVDARLALPLTPRERLACLFRTPDGCLPADALQVYPPDLGFAYRPNLNVVLWHPESGSWTLSTDRHGFANTDPTLHDGADVVVLGGSFVQGTLVDPEESFPARLAARTGRRVLNLGVQGWDAYHYPIALSRYGLRARPRVVVAAIVGSRDRSSRFALFADYRREHPGADYRDFLDVQARARRPPGASGAFGLPERLYRRAYLPAAVGALLAPPRLGDYEELTLAGRPVRLRLADAFHRWRAIEPDRVVEEQRTGIERLGRAIGEMRTLAAEAGARLLVLYVPAMEEVYLPLVAAGSELWGPTPKARLLEKLARLREVVTSHVRPGELLDLTEPLAEVARGGETLYWIHDPHWNRRGNAAVAEIVARRLAEAP